MAVARKARSVVLGAVARACGRAVRCLLAGIPGQRWRSRQHADLAVSDAEQIQMAESELWMDRRRTFWAEYREGQRVAAETSRRGESLAVRDR